MKKLIRLSLIFAGFFGIISVNETEAVLKYEPVKIFDDLMTDRGFPSPDRVDAAFETRRSPENGTKIDAFKQIYRNFIARRDLSVEDVDPKPQFIESALDFNNSEYFWRYLDELGKTHISVDMHKAHRLQEFLAQISYDSPNPVNAVIDRGEEDMSKIFSALLTSVWNSDAYGDATEAKIALLEFLKRPEIQQLVNNPGKLDEELARLKRRRL